MRRCRSAWYRGCTNTPYPYIRPFGSLNAYVIAFGGLLLLGGRLSDLLGARRVFTAGWALLAVASLAAGLADATGVEIAARS